MQVEFHAQTVGAVERFGRVAGPADAPIVLLAGALAYRRDLPRAEIVFGAGHFALETHVAEIGAGIRRFLAADGAGQPQ